MSHPNSLTKTLRWFGDAGLKALVVLLLVVGGYAVYAAISWPGNAPNPTTGVVGMFVGESATAFDAASSYEDVNKKCSQATDEAIKGSHVCTPDEMANSYNNANPSSAVKTYVTSKTLWINNGPPAFTANANDCRGWAETEAPTSNMNYGTVWNFESKSGGLLPCKTGKKFACCK